MPMMVTERSGSCDRNRTETVTAPSQLCYSRYDCLIFRIQVQGVFRRECGKETGRRNREKSMKGVSEGFGIPRSSET